MRFKLSKKIKWFLVILFSVFAFFLIMGLVYSGPPTQTELNQKFIIVNPLDPTQIKGFSKYRSCAGHDYRGPTLQEGVRESTPRSMKHYIKVKEELRGKNNVVKAIAPFDGKISNIERNDPERTSTDQQVWLTPENISKSPREWHFVFFHIDLDDNLIQGSKVKAGQVIGTASLSRGPENATDNFDMAVKFTRPMAAPAIDIPFAHATDEVLAEYRKYGVTLPNMVISKEFRDNNLCPTTGESMGGDVYFPPGTNPNDYIFFK